MLMSFWSVPTHFQTGGYVAAIATSPTVFDLYLPADMTSALPLDVWNAGAGTCEIHL